MARKSIKKSVRFEVFKRDSFTCQYCGKSSPDVVLHVDHIKPVVEGGDNDIMNLITSCADCNLGKGARELDDQSILMKQKQQLDDLNERRQQLEMMIEWREEMNSLIDIQIEKLIELFERESDSDATVTENGRSDLKKMIHKHGFTIVYDSVIAACTQYKTPEKMFKMISRIAYRKANPLSNQDEQLYYIRGILRNRIPFLNEWSALQLLKEAVDAGASMDELTNMAKEVSSWREFVDYIDDGLGR